MKRFSVLLSVLSLFVKKSGVVKNTKEKKTFA